MPDETKVFIEQLSEKLRGIAGQLDVALKLVQAGRTKLNNILSKQFNANEFAFVQKIGEQIQQGLNSKTLQVGTTISICDQILEKVDLIKRIKIDGVNVDNNILTSAERSENVKGQLTDIAAKAAEMAKDKGAKSGKKKAVLDAIDGLIKALKAEMKNSLGLSEDFAGELGVTDKTTPEEIEELRTKYINDKLNEAGIANAWDLKDDSAEVTEIIAGLGNDLSKLPGELPRLEKTMFDKVVAGSSTDDAVSRLVDFLGLDSPAGLLAPDRAGDLASFRSGDRGATSNRIIDAEITDGKVAAVSKITEAADSEDSAKAGDLDGFLDSALLAGKNLGNLIAGQYASDITKLIDHANNFVANGEGEPLSAAELLERLKSLKFDNRVAANEYLRVDTIIRNNINDIEKEDKKTAGKILTSFEDIGTATSEDELDNKIKACEDVIAKIIDKVDTKGSTVDVGGYDELFGD